MDDSKPWDGHPTQEDLDIERAEQGFADPGSANMQFLQSTLPNSDADSSLSTYSMQGWASPGKASHSAASSFPGFSNLAPAYSGLGLIGAVGSADFAGGGSALGLSSAVAAAAPAAMGKTSVGDSAALAAMGAKAMAPALPAERFTDGLPLMKAGKEALVPLSPEFEQLMAMLGVPSDFDAMDPAQLLISGGGTGAENLQSAIDAVMDQITLLNNTFEPLMEGLSGEVQSQVAMVGNQSTTDLGLNILSDAQSVSSTLGDVLGTVNVGANPQFAGLLNLGSAIDEVLAVVDTLPTLDPVTTPIADIVGGVLNPITEPVTDIVGGIINNPVTSPITDPITEPVTDIVGGIINNPVTSPITDPITEPVTDIVG
ncbi:hypothetical protein, partial [Limnobacter sp.]|uniref:hypothetical protein n=1 Tax=Limnobacter sp. TaxID=2003368 RepID=UPI003511AC2C